MLHLIAQTTQPVARWTASDVCIVIACVSTVLLPVLLPGLIALVKAFKTEGAVQAQAESLTRVTNRMNTQDAKLNDVAIATGVSPMPPSPPPEPPPRVQT
jgi:hypothetical protein